MFFFQMQSSRFLSEVKTNPRTNRIEIQAGLPRVTNADPQKTETDRSRGAMNSCSLSL